MNSYEKMINQAFSIDLAKAAYLEFCNVADYVWKTPRLLDTEKENELNKLPLTPSNEPDLSSKRWQHEG